MEKITQLTGTVMVRVVGGVMRDFVIQIDDVDVYRWMEAERRTIEDHAGRPRPVVLLALEELHQDLGRTDLLPSGSVVHGPAGAPEITGSVRVL